MVNVKRWIYQLELFELTGIAASCIAAWIFFSYGSQLDGLMHIPGYHWQVVTVIASIYGHFVPYAVAIGAIIATLFSRWLKIRRAEAMRRFVFGVRIFLSYCVLLILFRIVNFYVPVLHPGIRDAVMQHLDSTLLFGRQAGDWLGYIANPVLTAIATGAYVSWFWLLFATIAILLFASGRAASEYVFTSLLTFYVGYVCYVLVPVIGPGYTLHFPVHVGDIAATYTLHRLTISRDCFPSLHTAISVLMVIYIWRYARRWTWLYLPMAVLIIFATLYLRFHYFTDDLAGLALAILMSQVAPLPWRWYEARRDHTNNKQKSELLSDEVAFEGRVGHTEK
jgi:membrane-associated phospholipid phosphatase